MDETDPVRAFVGREEGPSIVLRMNRLQLRHVMVFVALVAVWLGCSLAKERHERQLRRREFQTLERDFLKSAGEFEQLSDMGELEIDKIQRLLQAKSAVHSPVILERKLCGNQETVTQARKLMHENIRLAEQARAAGRELETFRLGSLISW